MRNLTSLVAFLAAATTSVAQPSPTWSKDVAPVIYRSCVSCHHDKGIAPFPLTTYEEVASVASMVNEAVVTRSMPPYPADITYRRYAHERALSTAEITTISEWVAMGSPTGNLADAPPIPRFDDGPAIKAPELVVTMPTYTSKAADSDVYRCFTMSTNTSQDRYIDALEVVPGNSAIVHHVLVFVDTSDVTAALDARDPEPGYVGFGGVGSPTAELVAVWAPGALPTVFPPGFGIRLPAGARMIFQMHYPAGTIGQSDASHVRMRFATSPAVRPVMISSALNHENIVNKPFRIPANQVKSFRQQYTVPVDIAAFAVAPHMHLIGKSAKVWARTPNADTIPLVSIPHWDFHWQIAYVFPTIQRIPRGTVLESEFTYDNTTLNEHNPSNPPREVRVGESTTDEMMLTFFYYSIYRPGDENIRLDMSLTPTSVSNAAQPELGANYGIAPNPATGTAWLRLPNQEDVAYSVHVVDAVGQVVYSQTFTTAGSYVTPLPLADIAAGMYSVHVVSAASSRTLPLCIVR